MTISFGDPRYFSSKEIAAEIVLEVLNRRIAVNNGKESCSHDIYSRIIYPAKIYIFDNLEQIMHGYTVSSF